MISQFRYGHRQLPKMRVGRLNTGIADEHRRHSFQVRSEPMARCANRTIPVLVDQEHRPSSSPLRTLVAHSVSSGATFSRTAGFGVLRSKPPCLITLSVCAIDSLRSTAALLTSPDKAMHRPSRTGNRGARISASTPTISLRQRAIHAAPWWRSSAIWSNVRPSPSSVAWPPVRPCQRITTVSTYFGSSSMP